jgi:hypothetical protein
MNPIKELVSIPPPQRTDDCPSTVVLEAHAASEAVDAQVAAHVDHCPVCQQYLVALRADQEHFRKQRPADLFLKQLEHREQRPRRVIPFFPIAALGFSALAVALILPAVLQRATPGVHYKGGSLLVFFKRAGMTTPQLVAPDQHLRPGDALRFSFRAKADGYLAILDLDGTRKVTVFHPYAGERPAPIAAQQAEPFPNSVVLDRSPGPEVIIAVFRSTPFELEPLIQQLKETPPFGTPKVTCDGCQVETLRIQKEP